MSNVTPFLQYNDWKQNVPSDYYQQTLIKDFTEFNKSIVNYDTPISLRNGDIQNKLSLNHLELIEYLVRLFKPNRFLELGVQFGELSKRIIPLVNFYVGVDMVKNSNIEYLENTFSNFNFYKGTTNLFFENYPKQIYDMVFIDADHSHKQSYEDFLNVKDMLPNDGIIVFHDTYPVSVKWTNFDLSGDCYKTSEIIRSKHNNEFEIFTFPINPGLSIARKCHKQLNWL